MKASGAHRQNADAIRQKLALGELPQAEPTEVSHGNGTGGTCAACDAPILNTQIQVRVEFASDRRLVLHATCFGVWQAERVQRGAAHP